MKTLWLTCPRATFTVDIDNTGKITWAAPIARHWIHQHIDDLVKCFQVDNIEEL